VEWLAQHSAAADTTVVSEPDDGIYDAMRKGLRLATGDLVNFLNAGDAYARPSVLVDVLSSYAQDRWRWGFGLARVVDASGQQVRRVSPVRYDFRAHALGRILISHQATFMERALLEELGGFDTRFGLQADVNLLVRAGEVATPAVWPRVDVEYLAGGASDGDIVGSMLRKHRIRMAIRRAGRTRRARTLPPYALDLGWTLLQMARVVARKYGKRVADRVTGGRFTEWWVGHDA
jgi:hypothetical protein